MARLRITIGSQPGYSGLGINGTYYQSGTVLEIDEREFVDEFVVYRNLLTIERLDETPKPADEPTDEPAPAPKKQRSARK